MTAEAVIPALGGGGLVALAALVLNAFKGKHAVVAEATDSKEFRSAVDERVQDAFKLVSTVELIDKRAEAAIEKFRDSTCLQKIIDDRFEHKMRSATMVFSSGLEIARSEIAAMKAANDLYNEQHGRQHDELLGFLRRMEKKVDAATVATAELRGKASVTDTGDIDDSEFPERSH